MLLFFFCLFTFSIGFSQTEKQIYGKVLSGELLLKDVDIVNLNFRKHTTTDSNGNFSILAKINDELLFISKEYTDRKIILTQSEFDKNNLVIHLEKEPIALNEVTITKMGIPTPLITQADLDRIKLEKQVNTLKVPNVYMGGIENGIDFIRLGKGIANLFKDKTKNKKTEKLLPQVAFTAYVKSEFDNSFLGKTLGLKPEEVMLFLSFCEADPKSKIILDHQEYFETMDFLITKMADFKKLINSDK